MQTSGILKAAPARVLLGSLFLTTGIAKIPVFREFQLSLASIAGLGPEAAFWFSAGVLGAEIIVGVMLVLGLRTQASGFCAMVMSAAFAGVQCAKLLSGAGTPCYCLGVLGNLPAGIALGANLLLVGLAVFVVRRAGHGGGSTRVVGSYAWFALVIPACLLAFPLARPDLPAMTPGGQVILQRLGGGQTPSLSAEREIVLCLDLDDLHCPLCFDDLIFLVDTLHSLGQPAGWGGAAAVLRLSEEFADSSAWRLRRWARETGITGPLAVVAGEEFDDATGGRSVIWLTRGLVRVERVWELPLGPGGRREVVSSLTGE